MDVENGGEEKVRDKSTCPGFDVADGGGTSKTRKLVGASGFGRVGELRTC